MRRLWITLVRYKVATQDTVVLPKVTWGTFSALSRLLNFLQLEQRMRRVSGSRRRCRVHAVARACDAVLCQCMCGICAKHVLTVLVSLLYARARFAPAGGDYLRRARQLD